MKNKLLNLVFLALLFNLLFAFSAFAKVRDITQDSNVVNVIASAVSGDTIRFFPGTYSVNILLNDRNLRIEGVDTKNTILKSIDGILPIIEVSGSATSTVIQNITFVESEVGILVADSISGLTIINNVFRLGVNNTALNIGESVSAEISNNTFYGNLINLENLSTAVVVKNNIFDNYDIFISGTVPNVVSFNCISSNLSEFDADNEINTQATFVDVDIDVSDFHLQEDSQCIDKGELEEDFDESQTDIGAYGGAGFDKIPDSLVVDSIDKDVLSAVVVTWLKSEDYLVEGYKLYYHTQPIYSEAQDTYLTVEDRNETLSVVDAVVDDAVEEVSVTLTDLVTEPQQPSSPVLKPIIPGKNKLALSWGTVEGATSYVVFYVTGEEAQVEVDVGDVTSYVINGLSNDLIYTVSLKAKTQLSYYFQVAAYLDDPDDTELTESYFVREDEKLDVGNVVLSDFSNKIAKQPEAIVAYPILPNEGCFIATAAFGYYSAQQVQVLRDFRDSYLLTNEVGREFVSWYYHYGPFAADIINEYAILKPVTRVFLYPLIVAAELLKESLIGFFLFMSFCFMLTLVVANAVKSAVVSQFRKRVSVI